MCSKRLARNTGRKNGAKKSPSEHHRTTLLGYIFATKPRVDNRKKLVKQQYLLQMSLQYGELRPSNGWDRLRVWGTPFQRVSRLGSVTARQSSSWRQPNMAALNRRRQLCSAGRPSRWALAHILVKRISYVINSLGLPALLRVKPWDPIRRAALRTEARRPKGQERGGVMGRWAVIPLPISYTGSGERCMLPQRGLGRVPEHLEFWCVLSLRNTSEWSLWCIFLVCFKTRRLNPLTRRSEIKGQIPENLGEMWRVGCCNLEFINWTSAISPKT